MSVRDPLVRPGAAFAGTRHDANAVKRLEKKVLLLEQRLDALEAKRRRPKKRPDVDPVELHDPMTETFPGQLA